LRGEHEGHEGCKAEVTMNDKLLTYSFQIFVTSYLS